MKPKATKNSAFGARGDADRAAIRSSAPRQTAEDEEHDRAQQPQQRVALQQPPAAHELEHDQQQRDGADDRDDLDAGVHQIPCSAATGAALAGLGDRARRGARPTKSASSTLTM